MIRKFINLLLISVIVFGIYSCSSTTEISEERFLPAERLIKKLEANRRKIKTFEGNGVLNIESPELSAKGNFEVLIKKPDSIMISIYGPFGIDLAKAVVTDRNFMFYDVLKNTLYKGSVDQDILKRIFKVNLSFNDLVDAFAGAVNLTENLRQIPSEYSFDDKSYFLTYNDSLSGKQSFYTVNADDLAIQKFEIILMQNNYHFKGNYQKFGSFDEVPIPYNVNVQNDGMNQKVAIDYRNIKVNHDIKSLQFNYPKDAKIVEL